jgi:hypothetical protein
MNMLQNHPNGRYQFLLANRVYSAAVSTLPGYTMLRAIFCVPPPYAQGLAMACQYLNGLGLTPDAMCGIELRLPRQLTLAQFDEFNVAYIAAMGALHIFVTEQSPITRTTVACNSTAIQEPALFAFSFVVAGANAQPDRHFLSAGNGEITREGKIVAAGNEDSDAQRAKVSYVTSELSAVLQTLDVTWRDVTSICVYSTFDAMPHLANEASVQPRLAISGVQQYPCQPPLIGMAFEMDVRCVERVQWLA